MAEERSNRSGVAYLIASKNLSKKARWYSQECHKKEIARSPIKFTRIDKIMQATFHLSTSLDSQSAKELKELILESEPDAKIDIDSPTKSIAIKSEASTETFDELICAAGYSIDKIDEK